MITAMSRRPKMSHQSPSRSDFHIYYCRSDPRSDPVFVARRESSIKPFAACFVIVNVSTCRIKYRIMLLS
jgi:hypothetical protein